MPVLSGAEALDPERRFGYIVAYPHSSNIELVNGLIRPCLSVLSRMSIDAAVSVWRSQPADRRVVIPGETLFAELNVSGFTPNTTSLMATRAKEISDMPDIDLVTELSDIRALNNTYLQTEALAQYLKSRGNGQNRVLLET